MMTELYKIESLFCAIVGLYITSSAIVRKGYFLENLPVSFSLFLMMQEGKIWNKYPVSVDSELISESWHTFVEDKVIFTLAYSFCVCHIWVQSRASGREFLNTTNNERVYCESRYIRFSSSTITRRGLH